MQVGFSKRDVFRSVGRSLLNDFQFPAVGKRVWVKISPPGDGRFESLVPFTRIHFGYLLLTHSQITFLGSPKVGPAGSFPQGVSEGLEIHFMSVSGCRKLPNSSGHVAHKFSFPKWKPCGGR